MKRLVLTQPAGSFGWGRWARSQAPRVGMDFLSSHSGCQVLLRAPCPGAGLALSPPRWQSPGASVAVGAPERGMVPSSPPGGATLSSAHTAGALQVGRPQTPVPWVGAPRPLGGHGLRLADLSGPRPGAQKLTHLGSTRPPHLCSPPSRPWAKPELRVPQTALPPLSASPPTTLGNVWRGAQAPPLGQCPSLVQAATPVWGPKGAPAPTDTTPGLGSR